MPRKKQQFSEENGGDGISYEPDVAGDKLRALKDELAQCKRERQEYLDGWQRLKADTVNARAQQEVRVEKAALQERERAVHELLPVLDSFDMARSGDAWQTVDEQWRMGVERICTQLEGALAQLGATRFGAVGDTFDAKQHEAQRQVPTTNKRQDGTIAAVTQTGWKLDDAVVRPARVAVYVQTSNS